MTERSGYVPATSSRVLGAAGTCVMFVTIIAGFLVTLTHYAPANAPATLAVVSLAKPASSHEAAPKDKQKPRSVEKRQQVEHQDLQIDRPRIVIPKPMPPPEPSPAPHPVDTATAEPETATSRALLFPAPPAQQAGSSAHDSWEERVLAALNENRRYPSGAIARRHQGVPYIRFVLDREGRVLSSRLDRSSGYSELDREAVALPRRSSPLPKPPASRSGDTVELVVPIEFFLR